MLFTSVGASLTYGHYDVVVFHQIYFYHEILAYYSNNNDVITKYDNYEYLSIAYLLWAKVLIAVE